MAYRYEISFDYHQSNEDATAPDIVYYNGDIINNGTDTPIQINGATQFDPQIRFNETRDVPILKDASIYNFSIVRFTMNGSGKDLPMFIPQIETNTVRNPSLNVNQTVYTHNIQAVLTFNDNTATPQTRTINSANGLPLAQQDYGVPCIYQSETADLAIAPIPQQSSISNGQQDLSTRYYWVYTYGSWLLRIEAPKELAAFLAYKGSIVVNGVSLTVNKAEDLSNACIVDINIIPHTLQNTTLGNLMQGDAVNLEVDLIARYVARMLETQK